MSRVFLVFLSVAMAWGALPCAAAPAKILFFGDSITQGHAVQPDQRWTSLVAAHSNGSFVEVNEGKGGRPAAAVKEFSEVADKYKSDPDISVLVIALGTNDSRDTSPDCVEKTANHISEMIALARSKAPQWRIIICAPYNINKDALKASHAIGPVREQNLIGMGKAYKALAAQEKCEFVDLYGLVPMASLLVDGVHPDAAGHALIAAFVQPTLDALVAKQK